MTWMRQRSGAAFALVLAMALVSGCSGGPGESAPEVRNPLREASSFDTIASVEERSKALFVEAGRVLQHPRCVNCHPSDAHPRQGEQLALHQPPVVRGTDNHGLAPATCETCHQQENVDHARMPGDPNWHLAPIEMGWIDESLTAICEQIKDTERNSGMTLEALHEHMAHDSLVGWAWSPGVGREPAPGTQASFARLIRDWIDTGAHCPDGDAGAAVVAAAPPGVDCAACHE